MKIKKAKVGLFPFIVYLCITPDRNKVIKFANKIHGTNRDYEEVWGMQASTFMVSGKNPAIWMSSLKYKSDYALLAHEVFHAVYNITLTVGINLSPDSEEVFAYMIENIMYQLT